MFKSYLIITFRNLFRHKFYSAINILGLSIGLTCFLFIAIFVVDELSYDKDFFEAENIYRMDFSGNINGSEFITALMSAPGAKTMVADYPEVVDAFRFRGTGNWYVKRKDKDLSFKEENVINADPNFFTFWNLELVLGDKTTCLSKPRTLVMDQTTATKIFGDEDPVGQMVVLDSELDYEVTGVYADFPKNAHFQYNIMLTMLDRKDAEANMWMSFNFNTYLRLDPTASPAPLEAKFPELIETRLGPEIQQYMNMSLEDFSNAGNSAGLSLMPLKEIHLYSDKLGDLEANGDIKYVYIFSAVGLFILILACINFMNLATARSANRAKEVGLRKVMGAIKGQLVGQFIAEAILITFISTIISYGLAIYLLPYFNVLSGKELLVDELVSTDMLLGMGLIIVVVGLLAGSYPAFYLSSFQPVETLKGKLSLGSKSGGLRSVLVVLQFTVSIIMIIGTVVVFNQLSFIQNKKLGFEKDHLLMIEDAWILGDKMEAFKNEALRDSKINSGTVASFLPVNTTNNNNIYFAGKNATGQSVILNNHYVDYDYIATLGMEVLDGRAFSKDFLSDSTSVILNESAVKQMGLENPIGSYVAGYDQIGDSTFVVAYKVIGVLKDFHYKSLKTNIDPLAFFIGKNTEYVTFKISGDDVKGTIARVHTLWDEFAPGQPFAHSFLDERFDNMYASEQKIGKIFGVFAFLAIFIACLGLFGLASFTAEQKRKEIGIRKVLGASVGHIVNKLSFSFIKLVVISFLVASPIAYFGMDMWLEDFVYRVDISAWVFLGSGIAAAVIAWLTMGFQSWKAARTSEGAEE
jgi:putative ABC transport system permease protein